MSSKCLASLVSSLSCRSRESQSPLCSLAQPCGLCPVQKSHYRSVLLGYRATVGRLRGSPRSRSFSTYLKACWNDWSSIQSAMVRKHWTRDRRAWSISALICFSFVATLGPGSSGARASGESWLQSAPGGAHSLQVSRAAIQALLCPIPSFHLTLLSGNRI